MKKVIVKNRKTGVKSEMTSEQWESTKKNPLFESKFILVSIDTPPELEGFNQTANKKATKEKSKVSEKENEAINDETSK